MRQVWIKSDLVGLGWIEIKFVELNQGKLEVTMMIKTECE